MPPPDPPPDGVPDYVVPTALARLHLQRLYPRRTVTAELLWQWVRRYPTQVRQYGGRGRGLGRLALAELEAKALELWGPPG